MQKLLALMVVAPAVVAAAGQPAASARDVRAAAPRQAAPSVRTTVVYGDQVTITGVLPEAEGPETVTVVARPYGHECWCPVGQTSTNADGAFVFLVKPTIATRYQVKWRGTTTAALTVDVRPRISFAILSPQRGIFSVEVEPRRPLAGRSVFLQRRAGRGWQSIKRVRVSSRGATRFEAKLPVDSSQLRIYMPKAQAAPGYVEGFS